MQVNKRCFSLLQATERSPRKPQSAAHASHRAQPTQATERSPRKPQSAAGIIAATYKLLQIVNKAWYNYVNLRSKSDKSALYKMPKNLINQMVKCAKKLINILTKGGNMQKRVASSRWQKLVGLA